MWQQKFVVVVGILTGIGCASEPPTSPADAPEPAEASAPDVADVSQMLDTPEVGTVQDTPAPAPDPGPDDERIGPGPPETNQPPAEDVTAHDDGAAAPTTWRSTLYPTQWTPDFTREDGGYLPDFSWAGYRHGEAGPLDVNDVVVDVVADHGADPTGQTDSVEAVRAAVAAVSTTGGTVWFPPGIYRLDGPVLIEASGVVLAGAGPEQSRLHFTQVGPTDAAHLRFLGQTGSATETALVVDAQARSPWVEVEDASEFAVGDDVALGQVVSEGFRADHQATPWWPAFLGTWQPFFRRTIVAIDVESVPHRVRLDVPLRYPLRVEDQASLRGEDGILKEVGVVDLGVSDANDFAAAWAYDRVHVIELSGVADGRVERVHGFAPDGGDYQVQSGGVIVRHSKRVTVADCVFEGAQNRGGGGNGYLFEVRQSSEVLFRDCVARRGRHNFIQNWGFGATGIVWLRITSEESGQVLSPELAAFAAPTYSEYHHSLATACLVDDSVIEDGWSAVNRRDWSTGAGHTATRSVVWNAKGGGTITSRQFDVGYVIGTAPEMTVRTSLDHSSAEGTAPEDEVEGEGLGASLEPGSLYEDQRAKRLSAPP